MKRHYIISIIIMFVSVVALNAQQNLRTAYFLDGYTYAYKMNPALQGERGFVSIPALGKLSLGAESNLGLSTFVKPSDGKLITFLHPEFSENELLKGMKHGNAMFANIDMPVLAFGFRTGKAYHTVDLSVRADADANLTKDLFHFMKVGSADGADSWDISDLGARVEARMELAYGYSRKFGEKVSVGARVKALMGVARADIAMDKMNLKLNGEEWAVTASGTADFAGVLDVRTKGQTGSAADPAQTGLIDWNALSVKSMDDIKKYMSSPSIGLALDLGVSVDLLDYLTVSASVLDLGFIGWKDAVRAATPETAWSFTGFENLSLDGGADISGQFESLADDLMGAMNFIKDGNAPGKTSSSLSATAHLGVEARMPFYDRLSVGLLGTHRFAGAYSWTEGRLSLNWALLRVFSLSGSYAISNMGNSLGAVANLHLPGFTLFAGVDSFLPLMNVTPNMIPIDSCNTNVALGLNIAFGKYNGRFPKN